MSAAKVAAVLGGTFVVVLLVSSRFATTSNPTSVDVRLTALELKLESHIAGVGDRPAAKAPAAPPGAVAAKPLAAAPVQAAAAAAAAAVVATAQAKGPGRKVFIDLGANCGNSYRRLLGKKYITGKDWEVYLWEANPQLVSFYLNNLAKKDARVRVVPLAAWTENKKMQFFIHKGQEDVKDIKQFKAHKCVTKSHYQPAGASSLFDGRGTGGTDDGERKKGLYNPGKPVDVDAVDFNAWFKEQGFTADDHILLKIDIEGAEIPLLKHMMENGGNMACDVDHYIIEWHAWLMKGEAAARTAKYETTFNETVWQKCGRDNVKFDPWH